MSGIVQQLGVIAVAVTAIAVVVGAVVRGIFWLMRPRVEGAIEKVVKTELGPITDRISEIHRQVSDNSHRNAHPTMPDLIDNVMGGLQRVLGDVSAVDAKIDSVNDKVESVREDLERHITDREEQKQLMRTLEAIALAQPPDLGGLP